MEEKINHIDEKRENVINWLKQFQRLPSSRFVGLMGIPYEYVLEILEQMESEGIVVKEIETNATYWKLK